jgi:hypothetical protein
MTALRKYERLESPGLWRATPQDQRREVIVGLRDATIVLADPKTEMALSQWSLPALLRLNPGQMPALYGPGDDLTETLEVDDRDMIAALDTVRLALERRRPRPGRLRGWTLGSAAVTILTLAVFWVPGKLTSHTAAVLPAATESALGQLALRDLERLTGSPCAAPLGLSAAQSLMARLFPAAPPRLVVLRDGLTTPLHLPGNIILLPAAMLDQTDGPDVVAGFVLAEGLRAAADDPAAALLRYAGLFATVRLLTSGNLGESAVSGYAETLLAEPPLPVPNADLLAAFLGSEVSASPYAFALDPSGQSVVELIEKDPFLGGSPRPVLEDGAWISLQGICTD